MNVDISTLPQKSYINQDDKFLVQEPWGGNPMCVSIQDLAASIQSYNTVDVNSMQDQIESLARLVGELQVQLEESKNEVTIVTY